ncbi:MAG: endonuclease/exonuclease/phosphatase family protein [Rikenellaceae bacterium]|jgi:endonuclease/exonuclease/phosphatase family metal-dependent hydrolase|nr:endonuclease/exonuclease/phosphatase family protein [Rikenellaceae bacterium]
MKRLVKILSCMLPLVAFTFSMSACGGDGAPGLSGGGIDGGGGPSTEYKYPKSSAKTIRLLTYNVFYCKGNTGTPSFSTNNIENVAQVIKLLDADVVSLQELDKGVASRGSRDLLQQIKEATGIDYQVVFSEASPYGGGAVGCGALVKKSLSPVNITQEALPGDEARKLIVVELADFVFMATHLDLNNDKRTQSATIINNVSNTYTKPVFLAGDLNDSHLWSGGGIAFPALATNFQIKSATDGTLPDQPGQTIDYILLNPNSTSTLDFKGTSVVKKINVDGAVKNTASLSDHYPVYLDIEVR